MNTFQKEFDKLFSGVKKKKLGIYGTGDNAKLIIDNAKNYQFICVISKDEIGNKIKGLAIVNLQQALKQCEAIVIAAIPSSTNIIWNRICKDIPKNFPVYDMRGNRLQVENAYTQNEYWARTKEQLFHEIDCHDVVSFDLFDTLLKRDVLQPRDIWMLLEQEINSEGNRYIPFYDLRVAAEKNANEIFGTPTYSEIYDELAKMCKDNYDIQKWLEREFELEEEHIRLRKTMWTFVDYAKGQGKKVIITSDMYFSCKQLQRLFKRCGIQEEIPVYVSSEIKGNKLSGKLYKHIKNKYSGDRILHIGDNYELDIKSAQLNGIDAFRILNGYDMLCFSSIANIMDNVNGMFDRLLLGRAISVMFDDPFILNRAHGKLYISDYRELSLFLYPMTYLFAGFIYDNISDYEAVIFPARDGYFFYDIFKDISPKAKYFYASRSAISSASVNSDEEFEVFIWKLRTGSKINVKKFLETQFQILVDKELDISVERGIELFGEKCFWEKIYRYRSVVLRNSVANRKKYEIYIQNMLLGDVKKVAVVDILAFGTLVHGISNLLQVPVDLIGIGTTAVPNSYIPDEKMAKTIYGNVNEKNGDIIYSLTDLSELHLFLEVVYSSQDGQFLAFDDEGNKIFLKESEYDSVLLKNVQTYLKEWLFMDKFTERKWDVSKEFAVASLRMLTGQYSFASHEIKQRFRFTDPYEKNQFLLGE